MCWMFNDNPEPEKNRTNTNDWHESGYESDKKLLNELLHEAAENKPAEEIECLDDWRFPF